MNTYISEPIFLSPLGSGKKYITNFKHGWITIFNAYATKQYITRVCVCIVNAMSNILKLPSFFIKSIMHGFISHNSFHSFVLSSLLSLVHSTDTTPGIRLSLLTNCPSILLSKVVLEIHKHHKTVFFSIMSIPKGILFYLTYHMSISTVDGTDRNHLVQKKFNCVFNIHSS